jgi:hypothetical protein
MKTSCQSDKDLVLFNPRLSLMVSCIFSGAIARCHRRSSLSLSLLGGRFQQHLEGARLTILFGKQQITVSLLLFFFIYFFF